MKARTTPRHALWILSGLALLLLGSAGCSGSKEAPAEKPFAENASTGSGTVAANSTDEADKSGKALAAMLPKTPPPKLVEETTSTENYPDKKPKVVRGVKRFSDNSVINHGHYISYYQNGQKFEEGDYVDNQKQGAWHMWYENGKEAKVENYLNGKPDGQWTLFNDKGLPEREASYKAGQRSGIWKYYFPDGKQLSKQEEYRDDKLDGTLYLWYPNGTKGNEYHYQAGASRHSAAMVRIGPDGETSGIRKWQADQGNVLGQRRKSAKTIARRRKLSQKWPSNCWTLRDRIRRATVGVVFPA